MCLMRMQASAAEVVPSGSLTIELRVSAAFHAAEMPVRTQAQEALLDVLWGLDEQALPGCAAGLGDLVRQAETLSSVSGQQCSLAPWQCRGI